MTTFFAKYPIINYDAQGKGFGVRSRDIMQRVRMRNILANNYLIFYPYTVKDGDTPEILAAKIYDSPQYHWIILICNNIIDPYYDWPLSSFNLDSTIRKRYTVEGTDGLYYAQHTTHHYEDLAGNMIDQTTYNLLPDVDRNAVSIYDWEVSVNEAKRQIQILDKRFVQQIDDEMDRLMKSPVAR
jgi:hypothetical protein